MNASSESKDIFEEKPMKSARVTLSVLTLLASALCIAPASARAGENIWTSNGPAAPVQFLASDPTNPGTLYAVSNSGNPNVAPTIFKTDGGNKWEPVAAGDLAGSTITCMAADPVQPATVYAGITEDVGGLPTGRLLSTRDGGAHWDNVRVDADWPSSASIAVEAASGSLYLGQNQYWGSIAPILRSSNGGQTWRETSLAKPHFIYALLSDSLNRTLLAGTDFNYISPWYTIGVGGNVARTVDGGAHWSLSPVDLGSAVISLAKNGSSTAYYAGTRDGGLYVSVDGGAQWLPLATLPGPIDALAVDPADSSILYAATPNRGVLRSTDRGGTWWSFNSGMTTRAITSLTIDSSGRLLHVGTDQGVFDLEVSSVPAPDACGTGDDHLCLFGSRFRVDLTPIDPFTKRPFDARAVAGNGHSGYFAFPSLTGDATFPEVMVKMVDATSLPGHGYWVYYAGMTSVLYTLTITDMMTGVSHEYSGENSCGGADVMGFLPAAAPVEAASAGKAIEAPLPAPPSELALLAGRFRIALTARDPATDADVAGAPIPQADRFGAFSLPELTGDSALPEVFVKMIDAGNGSFLLFYAGLTHLDYSITVIDTVTGTKNAYVSENADPRRPCGAGELLAFAQ